MSKTPDFSKLERAYLMFSAGISQVNIAKEFGVSTATIQNWKNVGKWDERIITEGSVANNFAETAKELTTPSNNPPTEVEDHIKKVVSDVLAKGFIKPQKWKDVLDTIIFLNRGKNKKAPEKIIDVSDADDQELDKELDELERLLQAEEDEADIVVPKLH